MKAAGLGSKAAFIAAAKQDASLISDLDPTAPSLEGYLFPDTYRFARHTDPQEMMAAMVKRFRQAAQSIGLTTGFHQTVTLASLVEKETPIDAERPLVASVFVNRLDEEHAADDGSVGDLRGAAGRAVSRDDLPVRSAGQLGVEHVSPCRAAAGTDLQSGNEVAAGGDASGANELSLFCCGRRGSVGAVALLGDAGRAREGCGSVPARGAQRGAAAMSTTRQG